MWTVESFYKALTNTNNMDTNMKSFLIFLSGAVVAGLLVWGFIAMQPAGSAEVANTDTQQTDTDTTGTGTTGTVSTLGQPVASADGHLLYTVNYNNGLFAPGALNIARGDSIKFVNKDNLTMRLTVIAAGSTSSAGSATDSHSLGKGGTYSLSFATPGVWIIQNLNDTGIVTSVGVVNVSK